jgi:hypothetical protein
VLAPRGRLALAVCGPLADAAGYEALAAVAEHVCSAEVLALLRSPFALGDKQRLAGLIADAGIADARIDTRACPVQFPSIDALVHTEVQASPIRDVIDAQSFEALLEGARRKLAGSTSNGGEVSFAISAHIVTARKP